MHITRRQAPGPGRIHRRINNRLHHVWRARAHTEPLSQKLFFLEVRRGSGEILRGPATKFFRLRREIFYERDSHGARHAAISVPFRVSPGVPCSSI
jgi:hypothetical protein